MATASTPDRIWPTVYEDDDEALRPLAAGSSASPPSGSPAAASSTTTGTWACPAPAARAARSTSTAARSTAARAARPSTRTATSSSGTSSSCSTSCRPVRAKDDFDIAGDLPKKNIDTGMGLERMATLLQGVDNLYEIDEVYPVLDRAAELTGKTYGAHSGHAAATHPDDVRLRVVADHVRSALMLIGDGVTPANEGRGYVLRRLLRRAVRSMRLLGLRRAEPAGAAAGLASSAMKHVLPRARDRLRPDLADRATPRRRPSGAPSPPARRSSTPRWPGRSQAGGTPLAGRRRPSSCTTPTASRST